MIRLIAVAAFALTVATSAEAMTPAPIPQPDSVITQVQGPVWRGPNPHHVRQHNRRVANNCLSWHRGVCRAWREPGGYR
jgi:hypothetical protein